jgi:ketosteroid isomerase-like protein
MDNNEVIKQFFAAFALRDGAGMGGFYHPESKFEDPVFGLLGQAQSAAMWKMLCQRGKDLEITLVRSEADNERGSADWEAKYTFQKTGKFVHNKVHSEFTFRDGLIFSQKDDFDFWKWASMALGTSGRLLGWTPMIKNAVRKEAQRSLSSYASAPPK